MLYLSCGVFLLCVCVCVSIKREILANLTCILYIAASHQPSLLYSGSQGVTSGVSPPGQMDTGGYLPPFLLGSPAAKSVSYVHVEICIFSVWVCVNVCIIADSLSLSCFYLISLPDFVEVVKCQ